MTDERIVERIAETVDPFMVHPMEAYTAGEAILAALRGAGFDVYRPDELDRDLKWQCQGRVWPAGKPIDPAEHRAEEGHRGCKWVRLVPVGGDS